MFTQGLVHHSFQYRSRLGAQTLAVDDPDTLQFPALCISDEVLQHGVARGHRHMVQVQLISRWEATPFEFLQ